MARQKKKHGQPDTQLPYILGPHRLVPTSKRPLTVLASKHALLFTPIMKSCVCPDGQVGDTETAQYSDSEILPMRQRDREKEREKEREMHGKGIPLVSQSHGFFLILLNKLFPKLFCYLLTSLLARHLVVDQST